MKCAVFKAKCHDSNTGTILHDEIQCKVLNEVCSVVAQRLEKGNLTISMKYDDHYVPYLTIQGVQHRVSRAISDGTASMRLASLSVVVRLHMRYITLRYGVIKQ